MLVRVKNDKRTRSFTYTIDGETTTGMAGEVLCKLLNYDWSTFAYEYMLYLETYDEKYLNQIESEFSQLPSIVQKMFPDIFPPTKQALNHLEKLSDIVGLIKKKINDNNASYDYFHFVLTNFYGYKPPIFPNQDHEISFLSYLIPLINQYCPIKYCKDQYTELTEDLKNISSTMALYSRLFDLRDLLKEESQKRKEYSFIGDNWPPHGVFSSHCNKICGLIEWYCFMYVDGKGSYYYEYDPAEFFEGTIAAEADRKALEKLNRETNIALLHHLCDEENAPYKGFFIDRLYEFNHKKQGNTYYLESAFDLVCHAVLYCYEWSIRPFAQCKYCKKFFPRKENSQEVCTACKDLTGNKKNAVIKEIFGIDLYGKINNIYRRLCYGKDGKYSPEKYDIPEDPESSENLLSPEQSNTLVKELLKLKNILSANVYDAYERYRGYQDPGMQEEFIEFVNAWINQIDEYYTLDKVRELILEAKAEAEAKRLKYPILRIKKITLNIIHIEESVLEIELKPTPIEKKEAP